jgi:transposase-like protein
MKGIDLPISPKVIVRLRGLLGHHAWREMQRWWEDRNANLKALSYTDFAKRHGRTPSAAAHHGARLNGKRHKQKLWWTAPTVLAVLASKKPDSEVAAALSVSPHSLRRLRSACRKNGLGSVARRLRPRGWWKAPEVLAVLLSGKKYRNMAMALGIGMGTLNSIISQSRQAGLGPARRYQNWWKTPEVQAALRSGKKYREMAAELGIGMSVLAWIITRSRRAGLGPPRRYRKRRNVAARLAEGTRAPSKGRMKPDRRTAP